MTTPRRAFLSIQEIAAALGISVSGVRRHVANGDIRSTRLGARILIPASELDRLAAQAADGGDAA